MIEDLCAAREQHSYITYEENIERRKNPVLKWDFLWVNNYIHIHIYKMDRNYICCSSRVEIWFLVTLFFMTAEFGAATKGDSTALKVEKVRMITFVQLVNMTYKWRGNGKRVCRIIRPLMRSLDRNFSKWLKLFVIILRYLKICQ